MKDAHILIIDDEIEIAESVSFALERAIMSCQKAHTAGDGLELLINNNFDLLVLDVGLPDQNGFELLKKIRKFSEIPVIMLTAQSDEFDRVLGLELGADDYLGKPFSPRELVARVKARLKHRNTVNVPESYSAEAAQVFVYDDKRQQISYRGEKLPLTLAEMRIFAHMLAHPNQVFFREQLLDAAFDMNHPSDPRTVDTHIKTLRQKLRVAACDADVIVTHRSLGYSYRLP